MQKQMCKSNNDDLIKNNISYYLNKVKNTKNTNSQCLYTIKLYYYMLENIEFVKKHSFFKKVCFLKLVELQDNENFRKYTKLFNFNIRQFLSEFLDIDFNLILESKFFNTNFQVNTYTINQCNGTYLCNCKYSCNCCRHSDLDSYLNYLQKHQKLVTKINDNIKFKNLTLFNRCLKVIYKNNNLKSIYSINLPKYYKTKLINNYKYILSEKYSKQTRSGKKY